MINLKVILKRLETLVTIITKCTLSIIDKCDFSCHKKKL